MLGLVPVCGRTTGGVAECSEHEIAAPVPRGALLCTVHLLDVGSPHLVSSFGDFFPGRDSASSGPVLSVGTGRFSVWDARRRSSWWNTRRMLVMVCRASGEVRRFPGPVRSVRASRRSSRWLAERCVRLGGLRSATGALAPCFQIALRSARAGGVRCSVRTPCRAAYRSVLSSAGCAGSGPGGERPGTCRARWVDGPVAHVSAPPVGTCRWARAVRSCWRLVSPFTS